MFEESVPTVISHGILLLTTANLPWKIPECAQRNMLVQELMFTHLQTRSSCKKHSWMIIRTKYLGCSGIMIAIYGFFLRCSPPSNSENYRFRETSPFKMWNFLWSLFSFSGSTPRWTPKNDLTSGSPWPPAGWWGNLLPIKGLSFLAAFCVCVCDSPVGRERIWFQHIYRGMCVCAYYIYIYVYMSCIHISMNFIHTPLRFGQLKTKFYKSEWNYEHFAHVEDHFWENLSLK